VIVIETIYGRHHAGAMPSAGTVHVKLTGGGIVNNLQKLACLFHGGIRLVNDGDVHVAHSCGLNGRLLPLSGIVSQIDYGFDSQGCKVSKVLRFWPGATIKALIHLAKVIDLYVGKTVRICLGKREYRKGQNKGHR
jgi:hypothetical protein